MRNSTQKQAGASINVVQILDICDGSQITTYQGTKGALIAAGIATSEMFEVGRSGTKQSTLGVLSSRYWIKKMAGQNWRVSRRHPKGRQPYRAVENREPSLSPPESDRDGLSEDAVFIAQGWMLCDPVIRRHIKALVDSNICECIPMLAEPYKAASVSDQRRAERVIYGRSSRR